MILPATTLEQLIPSFEALFEIKDRVTVVDTEGMDYFGTIRPDETMAQRAPIAVDGEAVGEVILYASSDELRWKHGVSHLGMTLSFLATEIWRRNMLADEVLERYDELNLIYGLGTSFIQGQQQEAIVKNVLDETNRIVRADAGVVYIWDADKSNIKPVSYFGEKTGPDFWAGRVQELALSTLYAYEQAQLFDADKIICAPLRYNEELLGAVVLVYERAGKSFRANDVNLLNTLSQNTALFMYAARLLERLAHQNAELVQTLTELQATKDKLSHAERLSIIGQTVGTLVHDMRKPLSNVMGYAGMLQDEDLPYDYRRMFADEIVRYVKTFSSMAQEILDYIAGDQTIQKTTVAVDQYMGLVADTLKPPGLEQPVEIVVNGQSAQGYCMNVDQQRFMRVFQNLVNNAIDAIESHGGTQVQVEVEPVGDELRFTVTDNGPGVPPEIAATLFEPFITMGKSHGTGLGLAIVERTISLHGGSIHYEPAPGGGARFVFTVPQVSNNGSNTVENKEG